MFERRGSGNFGYVYRGRDLHLERDVAVKLMETERVTLDATLTEARIHALCAHPNVVTVYDVTISAGAHDRHGVSAAGSAEDRLAEGVAITDALRWTRNALQGLAHAHGLGILHRDLKPANLMLLANGEAALSDFGIAEDTIRGRFATDMHYWPLVAPELLDLRPTSVQSDIWAMGCLLYRLLTGGWPFPSIDHIHAGDFEPPQRFNPQVTRALTRVVAGALDQDLATRFSSARAMLAELAKCRAECSWTEDDEDDAITAWRTTFGGDDVAARIVPSARNTFEVEVTIDKGNGHRRAQPNQRVSSEAQARQRLATILRNGVEGKPLR